MRAGGLQRCSSAALLLLCGLLLALDVGAEGGAVRGDLTLGGLRPAGFVPPSIFSEAWAGASEYPSLLPAAFRVSGGSWVCGTVMRL
jgi:hypothetical protein